MTLRCVVGVPPNFERIADVLPAARRPNVYFCYGDTVFMASAGMSLTPALFAHEKVHSIRQQGDPESWWSRYLTDLDFRLAEELAGHQAEYFTIKIQGKSRAERRFDLRHIAERLSGPLYGSLLSFDEAKRLIDS